MRGKAETYEGDDYAGRITPAYAGKSRPPQNAIVTKRDHPRLCGEKLLSIWQNVKHSGSPPPMRGKVHDTADKAKELGITPAYAGKSCCIPL